MRHRVQVLRRHGWTIFAAGCVFLAVTSITEPTPEARYRAAAQADLGGLLEEVLAVYPYAIGSDAPKFALAEAAAEAQGAEVQAAAFQRLGGLPSDLEFEARGEASGRITFEVEGDEARPTARVANVLAEEWVKLRNREYRRRIEEISRELRRARSDAGVPPSGVNFYFDLLRFSTSQFQTRLELLERLATPAAVAERARVPREPVTQVGPAGAASMLGISLAIVAAFLLEALRRRREDPVIAAEIAGVEPLGLVEAGSTGVLGTAIADLPPGPAVVAVCGVRPGGRPRALAAALGAVGSERGLRTVVVDADRSEPGFVRLLGLPRTPGLTELAAGTASPSDVVHPTREPGGEPGPGVVVVGSDRRGADLLPALARLAAEADLVVVVVPPPTASADLALLSGGLHRVLVVVEREMRGDDELEATGRALGALDVSRALVLVDRSVQDRLAAGTLLGPVARPAGDRPDREEVAV